MFATHYHTNSCNTATPVTLELTPASFLQLNNFEYCVTTISVNGKRLLWQFAYHNTFLGEIRVNIANTIWTLFELFSLLLKFKLFYQTVLRFITGNNDIKMQHPNRKTFMWRIPTSIVVYSYFFLWFNEHTRLY